MFEQTKQDDPDSDLKTASTDPSAQAAVGSLISAVPLLVSRSLRQFELASSLLVALSCHLTARSTHEVTADALLAAGAVRPEPLDVLDVLNEDSSNDSHDDSGVAAQRGSSDPEGYECASSPTTQILEADLGVPDYDSLAASQVVPRLAMLATSDLQSILAYEQAHRRRQTIMNRVTELLDSKAPESE